jgi:hypothetical protein
VLIPKLVHFVAGDSHAFLSTTESLGHPIVNPRYKHVDRTRPTAQARRRGWGRRYLVPQGVLPRWGLQARSEHYAGEAGFVADNRGRPYRPCWPTRRTQAVSGFSLAHLHRTKRRPQSGADRYMYF